MTTYKQKMIQEEQKQLGEVIEQIETEIGLLESSIRKPEDYQDQQVQFTRKKKLTEYRDALSSPYFGKLELLYPGEQSSGSYLLGEMGVSKSGSEEIVLDWRSPVGDIFYSFNGGNGQESYKLDNGENHLVTVFSKRNIKIENTVVTGVNETRCDAYQTSDQEKFEASDYYADDFLDRFGSDKSKDYQLRKIIATIQKEQNEAIRLGILEPILIQGVAGSGKTSIALHRLSYLLYQYRKQLNAEKILILAPSRLFISYMQNILPGLELERIQQNTFIDLVKGWLPKIKHIQSPQEWLSVAMQNGSLNESKSQRYKGSMSFYRAIERYLDHIEEHFFQPEDLFLTGSFSGDTIHTKEQFDKIYQGYKHLPLNFRLKETKNSIKNWISRELENQEKVLDDKFASALQTLTKNIQEDGDLYKKIKEAVNESRQFQLKKQRDEWTSQINGFLDTWLVIDSYKIYNDLLDSKLLQGLDSQLDGELAVEVEASKPDFSGIIGYDDIAPILLIKTRLEGIKAEFDYMMIDEAQDLSVFQLAILKKLTKSMTILGDYTQSIFGDLGMQEWDELTSGVFDNKLRRLDLLISYRSTSEIMNFANHVIKKSGLSLPLIHPINRHGEKPKIKKVNNGGEFVEQIQVSISELLGKGYRKIAIINKDPKLSRALYTQFQQNGMTEIQLVEDVNDVLKEPVIFISSALVKGLEFDAVIIANANKKTFSNDPLDTKLLFVSVTRAQEELHLFYYGEPSPLFEDMISLPEGKALDLLEALL